MPTNASYAAELAPRVSSYDVAKYSIDQHGLSPHVGKYTEAPAHHHHHHGPVPNNGNRYEPQKYPDPKGYADYSAATAASIGKTGYHGCSGHHPGSSAQYYAEGYPNVAGSHEELDGYAQAQPATASFYPYISSMAQTPYYVAPR